MSICFWEVLKVRFKSSHWPPAMCPAHARAGAWLLGWTDRHLFSKAGCCVPRRGACMQGGHADAFPSFPSKL